MKTLEFKGLKINYDLDELIKEVKDLDYNQNYHYVEHENDGTGKEFHLTKTNYNKGKKEFIRYLKEYEDESILVRDLGYVTFTMKGLPKKNKNQIILDPDFYQGYSAHWGSHAVEQLVVQLVEADKGEYRLILRKITVQHSF